MHAIRTTALLMLALPAHGIDADRDLKCEEIKQEIRTIQSKMRAGYSRAEGEKLEARLRKLRALRSRACR